MSFWRAIIKHLMYANFSVKSRYWTGMGLGLWRRRTAWIGLPCTTSLLSSSYSVHWAFFLWKRQLLYEFRSTMRPSSWKLCKENCMWRATQCCDHRYCSHYIAFWLDRYMISEYKCLIHHWEQYASTLNESVTRILKFDLLSLLGLSKGSLRALRPGKYLRFLSRRRIIILL